jgi:hypothetical protein
MAVSKRLRFEILRRDNHTCRYCGRSAPEVKLTVDHVKPDALGGTDDPANLVAACADCNGGKSSSSPDAPLVEDVSNDAVRWTRAIRQAAEESRLFDNTAVYEAVVNAWTSYRRNRIPADYRETIDRFLAAGLPAGDIVQMAHVADAKPSVYDQWAYFCGCCWTRVRKLQERAEQILAAESAPSKGDGGPLCTTWTAAALESRISEVLRRLVEVHNYELEAVSDRHMYSCVHSDDLADCGDPLCVYVAIVELLVLESESKVGANG